MITIVVVLYVLSKIPARYRDLDTPRVRSLLEVVYVRGFDQAYLTISKVRGPELLRVYKSILSTDAIALSVYIPAAASRSYNVRELNDVLTPYGVQAIVNRADHAPPGGVTVPIGSDISKSVVVSEFLLRDVLKVDPRSHCVASTWGCDPNPNGHPGLSVRPSWFK
jgi:hypothetical protein